MKLSEIPREKREEIAGSLYRAIQERVEENVYRQIVAVLSKLDYEIGEDDKIIFGYNVEISGAQLRWMVEEGVPLICFDSTYETRDLTWKRLSKNPKGG